MSCTQDSFQGTYVTGWFNVGIPMDGYVIEYKNSWRLLFIPVIDLI